MLRKEDLWEYEEESYHRDINKEKVQIRRNQREVTFNRKRNNFVPTHYLSLQRNNKSKEKEHKQQTSCQLQENISQAQEPIFILDQRYSDQIRQANRIDFPREIEVYTQLITAESTLSVICGTIGLRRLLSQNVTVIQEVINAGLVNVLIQLINYEHSAQVQLEATWCIANIAAGTTLQCKTLIDRGAVPLLVDIVNQHKQGIVEQAIWALGNICADCSQFRNMLLDADVGQAISNLILKEDLGDWFQIECCWTLANLCRGEPLPEFERVRNPMRIICSMVALGCITSQDIFIDCCWAISYHYSGKNDRGRDVLDFNLLERIVPVALDSKNTKIIIPIMRIIGQLSQGGFNYTDHIIEKGCLDLLQKCIQHDKKLLRREAAWILSNLTASDRLVHIKHILGRDVIIIKMIELFARDVEEVRKEIAYFFSNMCYASKTLELEEVFTQLQITSYYVQLLKSDNFKVIKEALECLDHILRFGEDKKPKNKVNLIAEELVRNGGINIIEELQYHTDDSIYTTAHSILENYYQLDDPLDKVKNSEPNNMEQIQPIQSKMQQAEVL